MRIVDQLRFPSDRLPTEYPWRVAVRIYAGRIGVYINFLVFGLSLFAVTILASAEIKDGITLRSVFWVALMGLVVLGSAMTAFLGSAIDSLLFRSYSLAQDRSMLISRLLRLEKDTASLKERISIGRSAPLESVASLGETLSADEKRIDAEIKDLDRQVKKWIQDNKDLARDLRAFLDRYRMLPIRIRIPQSADVESLELLINRVKSMLPSEA